MAKTNSRRNTRRNGRKRSTPKSRKRNGKTNKSKTSTQTPALATAERALRIAEVWLRIWPHLEPAALNVWQWLEGWLSSML